MIFLKGRKRDNNFAMSSLFKLQLFADSAYLIFGLEKKVYSTQLNLLMRALFSNSPPPRNILLHSKSTGLGI